MYVRMCCEYVCRLLFGNRELFDKDTSLAESKIVSDSTLFLLVKPVLNHTHAHAQRHTYDTGRDRKRGRARARERERYCERLYTILQRERGTGRQTGRAPERGAKQS